MATAVTTPVRSLAAQTRSPLALWHLLSLDAPTVAVLWTVFLSRLFNVALHWTTPAALGLAVWMVYAADRVSDAARGGSTQERHRFHYRHRRLFTGALLCAAPLLAALVFALPHATRTGWLLLAIPMACYVFAVHVTPRVGVPKEPLVAAFFVLATMMPVVVSGRNFSAAIMAALPFGLLCLLNCAAIARWEFTPAPGMDRATAWISVRLVVAAGAMAGLCFTLAAWLWLQPRSWSEHAGPCVPVLAAVGLGAALLALLDGVRTGPVTRRALADAALLAPLLVWPFLSHAGPR